MNKAKSSKKPVNQASNQPLGKEQKKTLRAIGHQLSPTVIVSNGLSDNIHAEIERALNDHELIKVKVNAEERSDKQSLVEAICATHKASEVQQTGNILLLYRPAKPQNPKLSNLVRFRAGS